MSKPTDKRKRVVEAIQAYWSIIAIVVILLGGYGWLVKTFAKQNDVKGLERVLEKKLKDQKCFFDKKLEISEKKIEQSRNQKYLEDRQSDLVECANKPGREEEVKKLEKQIEQLKKKAEYLAKELNELNKDLLACYED